jgi:L-asparaginase type I
MIPIARIASIALLTTGGTIAQRSNRGGVAHPVGALDRLVEQATPAGVEVEVHPVLSKGSKDMRPADWQILAGEVAHAIRRGVRGVVVLHGTDTMAYTAAALSFMLSGLPVPVVLTGSMRPGDDEGSDALANLRDALLVAAHADLGEVVVVFSGDEEQTHAVVLRGNRCRKVHSHALAAFAAVDAAPLGLVRNGRVQLTSGSQPRTATGLALETALDPRVALVTATPALSADQLSAVLTGAAGVVVEGTGTGHVHQDLVPVLAEFAQAGGAVVMSTQVERGGERLGRYSTDVDASVVPGLVGAGTLTREATLVKLMCALARADWRQRMRTDVAGELSAL